MTSLSSKLATRVAEAGFEIAYDPPADGKCFYHAASFQIDAASFQIGFSSSKLTAVIFEYLKDHQFDENGDDRLAFLCETDLGGRQVPGTWPEALEILQNNYANSLVIQALADALHYKLVIITALGDENFIKIIEPKEGARVGTLFFGHTGNHYVALRPMDKEMCHYAEVLKRNLVDDKQPPGQAASPEEPVTSKSSSPLQHTLPKPKLYKPKNKLT